MWVETSRAWQRLKLSLAAYLVITVAKGDHSLGHQAMCLEACGAIEEFRNLYYRRAVGAPPETNR